MVVRISPMIDLRFISVKISANIGFHGYICKKPWGVNLSAVFPGLILRLDYSLPLI